MNCLLDSWLSVRKICAYLEISSKELYLGFKISHTTYSQNVTFEAIHFHEE